MGRIVHGGAHNGPDAELGLVDGEDDAAEMSGRNLVDVDLGKGEEPANGNACVCQLLDSGFYGSESILTQNKTGEVQRTQTCSAEHDARRDEVDDRRCPQSVPPTKLGAKGPNE